ncbi:MAG: DUF5058 family protein [Clostridia bacterium]|nr:DUF5058 family protein [Clostridia bacterium]
MNFSPNSPFMYVICGIVILFVIAQSIFFLVRALRQAKVLKMDQKMIRRTISASAIFTIAPALAILIGVISLSQFLGLPLPWLRLSVLGALTYELPAAQSAASAMNLHSTSELVTDPVTFSAISWVMTLGILSGIVVVLFGLRKIQKGVVSIQEKDSSKGTLLTDSLFLGMISAFSGLLFADIRSGLPGFIPLAVALVSMVCMGLCGLLIRKAGWQWLEQYALPLCMLCGMAAAIPLTSWMGGV